MQYKNHLWRFQGFTGLTVLAVYNLYKQYTDAKGGILVQEVTADQLLERMIFY
jgi:hypothetical protein